MKVLLAHPPLSSVDEVTPPLGLCTLAGWLLKCGHNIRIIDLNLEVKKGSPALFVNGFLDALEDFQPDIVGITSMYNNSLQAERLLKITKEWNQNTITVAGGSHFGACAEHSLRRIPSLDYVIVGEGELTFSSLLSALELKSDITKVPRLAFRISDGVRENAPGALMNLADLPNIWQSLSQTLDIWRYYCSIPLGSSRKIIYIEAGRGCPFKCSFCATAPFWERKHRVRPIDTIVSEIRYLHEEFGYDSFILVHDLLTVDRTFVNEFCNAMIDSKLPVSWMANHRTDVPLPGLLPKMKTAGCWKLFMGIESASPRIQLETQKRLQMHEVVSTVKNLKSVGIGATCSFVIGFPAESPEELSDTIRMGALLKTLGIETVQFHRLRTWPPAPLASQNLPASFDVDSLRIEYPFIDVPEDDIGQIQQDPMFFAGYFAPQTAAGSFSQVAQSELFFNQAVAMAPLTIALLGQFLGASLISSFYWVLSKQRRLSRADLDTISLNLANNWVPIERLLREWISSCSALLDWQRSTLVNVFLYESRRLTFVTGPKSQRLDTEFCLIDLQIDLQQLIQNLCSQTFVNETVQRGCSAILVRRPTGAIEAYTAEPSLFASLPDDERFALLKAALP